MDTAIPAPARDFFFQRGRGTGAGSASDQQIRLGLRFDGLLDPDRLRRALEALVAEEPVLRARFVEDRPFEGRWVLREDPGAVPACSFVALPDADAAAAAAAAFLADLEIQPDGPYVQLRAFRAAGRDTLCLRVDHRLCDGGGAKLLVYRLADRYRRLGAGAPLPPPRDAFAPRTVHDLLGRSVTAPPPPPSTKLILTYALPRHGSANERPALVVRVLDAPATQAIRRAARAAGGTLTDALIVALARGLQPHATVPAGAPLSVLVSADGRSRLPAGTPEALCNLFNTFFPTVRCDPAQPVAAAVAEVAREMARQKAGLTLEALLHNERVIEASFRHWETRRAEAPTGQVPPRETVVLLSNVGVLEEDRLDFGGPALADARLLGTVALGPQLLLCASGFRGALTLSIGLCESDLPRAIVEGILDRIVETLRALGGL